MSTQISKDAKRLAHEIFTRTAVAGISVFTFRVMGQLGLPQAKNEEARTWERIFNRVFARAEETAALLEQKNILDVGFVENQTKEMTEKSVTAFESALDAASLIFSHSLLDAAAFDWCRVCALACPDDFMRYIGKRKVTLTLSDARITPFSELRDKEICRYLKDLEKKSLAQKVDILFALCAPPPSLPNYRYDKERIVALDNLRHDYVHRGWLAVACHKVMMIWCFCQTQPRSCFTS